MFHVRSSVWIIRISLVKECNTGCVIRFGHLKSTVPVSGENELARDSRSAGRSCRMMFLSWCEHIGLNCRYIRCKLSCKKTDAWKFVC